MRVLHIIHSFSRLSETFIYDYITELERQGIDNYIQTFERINKADRPFDKVHVARINTNISWYILKILNEFNIKPDRFWALQRRAINKIVKNIKPDIIHAHFGPMGVLVAPIANKLNIPFIVSFHGFDASMLLQDNFWIKNYKSLNNCASCITVISNNMLSRLSMFDTSKVRVIHVGKRIVDYNLNNRINDIKNFLSVGRLAEKKGYFDLIEAFSQVIQKFPDITLSIIGDGPLRNEIQEIIHTCQADNNIKLLGALKHNETLNYYKRADAFILTSKSATNGDMEGIPTVLMEAQAFGLPVISTKHSGIPECIPEENHKFLAEEGNIEQIKNCIISLIETDSAELQKIIERGRKKVEDEFNLEIEVNNLIALYNRLLQSS